MSNVCPSVSDAMVGVVVVVVVFGSSVIVEWIGRSLVHSFSLRSHARSGVAEARRDGRKLAEISVKRAEGQEDKKFNGSGRS